MPADKRAYMTVAALDNAARAELCLYESRWPLLSKLHGDFQSVELKNTSNELKEQDAKMRSVLTTTCARFGLVIVGYSGRDSSVMEALTEALDQPNALRAPLNAIQETLGFSSSAVQQAMKTVKQMRLFEESESVAKAIKQMDSLGALAKSIQALNQKDCFARAVKSFNAMHYQPQFGFSIPDFELSESIALIESATESDFADIFTKLSPRIQGILIFIFYRILFPIALGVAGNLMTPYFEKAIKSEKLPTSQVRVIKKTPFQYVDASILRFVLSNDVKLRAKPSTRSEVLDVLGIGQVITVLERKKGWAEVIYENDDGQTCQGWIMTRYTAKFKN